MLTKCEYDYYYKYMAKSTEKNRGVWIVIFLIGAGAGLIFSQLLFHFQSAELKKSQQQMQSTHSASMHSSIEVSSDTPTPSIQMELKKDSKAGYNLSIKTENYTFTPEKVNAAPVQGEGHAHIYIDGVKIARLYGTEFHIPTDTLSKGVHEVQVTLNANDHSDWVKNGAHIQATGKITVE